MAERRRKISVFESESPSIPSHFGKYDLKYRSRRRSLQARKNSRDKDFFVPDSADEWVLPEYRSLFHHIFLRDEDETGSSGVGSSHSHSHASSSPAIHRRRKISPSGSTGSSTTSDDDGPLCNFVKKLKKVFHISDSNDEQQHQDEVDARHAWLDEIPIEICDKLRHIHIYV